MKSELVLVLLTACVCACAHADCLGSDLNNDGSVDANDAPVDLEGDEDADQAGWATLAPRSSAAACPVVINEVLAHAHADAPDWIELYNTGSVPVNIGGWMLSDNEDELDKFRIAAGTVLKPFGYVVFYEDTHFGNARNPGARPSL